MAKSLFFHPKMENLRTNPQVGYVYLVSSPDRSQKQHGCAICYPPFFFGQKTVRTPGVFCHFLTWVDGNFRARHRADPFHPCFRFAALVALQLIAFWLEKNGRPSLPEKQPEEVLGACFESGVVGSFFLPLILLAHHTH